VNREEIKTEAAVCALEQGVERREGEVEGRVVRRRNEHDEDESCRSHDPSHVSHVVDDIVSGSDQVTCWNEERKERREGER